MVRDVVRISNDIYLLIMYSISKIQIDIYLLIMYSISKIQIQDTKKRTT